MNTLYIDGHATLDWVKPHPFRREYELWFSKDLVGNLKFSQDDKCLTIAESADGKWFFRGTRYINPRVSIWTQIHDYVAAFEGSQTGKGNLRFLDGRNYRWEYKDQMQMDWVFIDSVGKPILCFKPASGRGKVRGKLEITSAATGIQELPMLCLLGWNIVILFGEL